MTQHEVVIQPEDKAGLKQWIDCLASMVDELRDLNHDETTKILDRYECRHVVYGNGLNVDWPDDKRPAPKEEEPT